MANRLTIEKFLPLPFVKQELDYSNLKKLFGVNQSVLYASKGRYAIIHILKSLSIDSGIVLISSYMCPTVKQALEEYGYTIEYYDINIEDLNPSIEDIKSILSKITVSAVVVPSLYGNPSDLEAIEDVCKKAGAKMIDDAAQSYGAELNGRKVGSFGDGGFFAFSPGKPTAGHMGAFYWSAGTDDYTPRITNHVFYHFLSYLDFYYNRYRIYKSVKPLGKCLNYLTMVIGKVVDIFNDTIAPFELPILGGVIDANNKYINYRNNIVENFKNELIDCPIFRVVVPLQGHQNNSKIVLVFKEIKIRELFSKELLKNGIFSYGGYDLPNSDRLLTNRNAINGKILELPIEIDQQKMNYMIFVVKKISQTLQ